MKSNGSNISRLSMLSGILDREEIVSFFIGVVGGLMLFAANIGSLVIFLTGRRKLAKEISD
jgi:hypothetical protein